MLKREFWSNLEDWRGRPHHPLVISGLRQVGKTYLVRAFGDECYGQVVYLDLRANKSVHDAFAGDFNVDDMVMSITASVPEARFVAHDTLLILDEVQDCPNARSSLKYWDIDGRYDVIATGSFLGVKGFRDPYPRGISVGYEEHLTMHPLNLREFLINAGIADEVMAYAGEQIGAKEPLLPTVHNGLRTLYLQYLIVGGMPEAVNVFLESHDLNAVREVQNQILRSIRDDFGRYRNAKGEDAVNEVLKLRAEACLDSLPSQLAKEYKKFQYSKVDARGNSTQKADGLQYLVDVGLVVKSYNLREITSPLEGAKIDREFKAFFSDTGLLVSQLEQGTAVRVLKGDLSAYKGAIAENMVASAFASNEQPLYYYHAPSGSPELDFIANLNGEPTIIECKSTNGRATSMRYVIAHPKKYGSHPAAKFADTNLGGGEGFVTYPLYALGFLPSSKTDLIVEPVTIDLP
ncbi:MAG: ATP-binding protein [Atopobiaceae bacterium]|nr:ATP-binding protein [Atopobiaceae bacterium]